MLKRNKEEIEQLIARIKSMIEQPFAAQDIAKLIIECEEESYNAGHADGYDDGFDQACQDAD